ncbi:hypothetical protein GALL_358500 [mine drainage metagenome]|uniref:Plastocyanin n=1 Tax=mine drainage metagenome TaxID=410659 RepID=A0A1J5QR58_9ZZZZ
MTTRAITKALLAGGLTTLATAALTVHAAGSPRPAPPAVSVHMTAHNAFDDPVIAVRPGQTVVFVNDSSTPRDVLGYDPRSGTVAGAIVVAQEPRRPRDKPRSSRGELLPRPIR